MSCNDFYWLEQCNEIALPTGTIKALLVGTSYKYLGVLKAEGFQHDKVKSRVKEVYKQANYISLVLKSPPNI